MSDQGISVFFQSLTAGVIEDQAVQAADMAARQGLASMRMDAKRQEEMVAEMSQAPDTAEISGEHPEHQTEDEVAQPRPRYRQHLPADAAAPGASSHQIDLLA